MKTSLIPALLFCGWLASGMAAAATPTEPSVTSGATHAPSPAPAAINIRASNSSPMDPKWAGDNTSGKFPMLPPLPGDSSGTSGPPLAANSTGVPQLGGILYTEQGKSFAVIDGKVLSVGDSHGPWKLAAITNSSVTLKAGDRTLQISLFAGNGSTNGVEPTSRSVGAERSRNPIGGSVKKLERVSVPVVRKRRAQKGVVKQNHVHDGRQGPLQMKFEMTLGSFPKNT